MSKTRLSSRAQLMRGVSPCARASSLEVSVARSAGLGATAAAPPRAVIFPTAVIAFQKSDCSCWHFLCPATLDDPSGVFNSALCASTWSTGPRPVKPRPRRLQTFNLREPWISRAQTREPGCSASVSSDDRRTIKRSRDGGRSAHRKAPGTRAGSPVRTELDYAAKRTYRWMQASDFGNLHDSARVRELDRPDIRRTLVDCP